MRSAAHAEHRTVHSHHHHHGRHAATPPGELKRLAFWATLHYLPGCAVGEILGLAIGTVPGWGSLEAIALAVGLAFVFGHAFTVVPLVRGGMAWRLATMVAVAADTASIAIMQSNASSARPAEEPETHPALVELLHHKALAVRHLAELQAARVPGESVPQAGTPN